MAENVLTRKIGPLPTWGWVTIVGAGVAGWALIARRRGGGSSGNTVLSPPEIIQEYPPEQDSDEGQDGTQPHHHHHRHRHRPGRKVEVPDVVGEEYPAAGEKIKDAGLIAQRGSPYVGKVTRESPHSGTKVRRGTVVTLSGKPWPKSTPRTMAPNAHPVR